MRLKHVTWLALFAGLGLSLAALDFAPHAQVESGNRIAALQEEAEAGYAALPGARDIASLISWSDLPSDVDKQNECLATAIYFEARGESIEGQLAVAQVVLNRVEDPRYPDNICGVVFQNQKWHNRCQFSFACDGLADLPRDAGAWKLARQIANLAHDSMVPNKTGDATHYHATYVNPRWAAKLRQTTQVGTHIFYYEELPEAFRNKSAE